MNDIVIRKPNGKIIGRIRDLGSRIEARTSGGVLLGWYDPASDKTRKSNGELFALGNLVSALL